MKQTIFILSALCFSFLSMAQWSSDPLLNTSIALAPGEEAIPKVATSIYATTYISWFSNEGGNYNVRLQKLDVYGNKLWADEGLLVSDNPAMTWLTDWDMTVDMEDCAILTFQDIRSGNNDVFAYRISPDGEFLWGEDGIEMSTGPAFDAAPKVTVSNSNNAYFAWQADEISIIQKISPEGEKLWGDNGFPISGTNTFSWPQLLAVGADDIIVKYFQDSGPIWAPTRHVYAMRFDGESNFVWESPVVISNAGGISAWTQVFSMIPDGNEGLYIAWHDDRDNDMMSSVFVQHVNSDGEILLGDDGTEASTMFGRNNFYPYLALPENSNDIYVFWNEMDGDQNNRGIYGQKISAEGERLWSDNGKSIIEISSTNVYPFSADSDGENLIVFFEKFYSGIDAGVQAMMLDTDGEFVWATPISEISSVNSEKVHTTAGKINNGQWITTWEDDRNGGRDIYAQNIKLDGSLGPVLPPVGILEFDPDTLFFYYNSSNIQEVLLINSGQDVLQINNIDEMTNGPWYMMTSIQYPYFLEVNESLAIEIAVPQGKTTLSIDYYEMNVYMQSDTSALVIAIEEGYVGIKDNTGEKNLKVYPNPSSSDVTFIFQPEIADPIWLEIIDLNGKLINKVPVKNMEQFIWDLTDMAGNKVPQGLYFYSILSENKKKTGKLIIRK